MDFEFTRDTSAQKAASVNWLWKRSFCMETENILKIEHVNKTFEIDGGNLEVLRDISLDVRKGEFLGIVGFSGCGKSTFLRILSGLEVRNGGKLELEGKEIKGPGLDRGMIFQESRLFPWMRVKENVLYGLERKELKKLGKKATNELAKKYIKLVKLEGFENAYPSQLSGGMQQRVSIARALIANPEILLLDEPFGALDAITRIGMQDEILRIREENQTTMILVTHDIDEAVYLCDRVVVLSRQPGEIKEIVDVNLPRPRNRTSVEFSEVRRKIYKLFFNQEKDIDIEYNI